MRGQSKKFLQRVEIALLKPTNRRNGEYDFGASG
jgi:hypothetical protein